MKKIMLSNLHVIDTHKTSLIFEIQKAEDPSTGKKYAVKIMRHSSVSNKTHHRLAKNEWKAVKSLKHKNLLSYHGFGKKDKRPYIIMEWIDSTNLKSRIAANLPDGLKNIPRDKVYDTRIWIETIVKQLIEVVIYIHQQNLIHCDLKPENFLLTEHDTVKLIDFSYARKKLFSLFRKARNIAGTPSFISPEQIKKEHLSEESDIYSLGATIYYLLTGHPPYSAGTVQELLKKHLRSSHKPLYGYVPGIRKEFSDYIDKMLAADKRNRLKNLSALRNEIDKHGIFPKLMETL